MNTPGEHRSEEPQDERGAPGSRDTGSDQPSGGPVDRPSGTYRGDDSVPAHHEYGRPEATGSAKTERPPIDTEPAVPPYEGRQTTAKPEETEPERGGARTAGATHPVSDPDYKSPPPSETPGGATASPAEEQPASQMPEADRDDDRVGPDHVPGVGKGERKL
ncbi:hypothetical protein [Mycolicibacterium tusciae]|uniref:hypothetical protein n=1 Tax=Mycolicibacterium tusciae TaxID=75922 RepID=UPI00024A4F4F|nr:hypothetical protein [Mycolicibacterium tusciae]